MAAVRHLEIVLPETTHEVLLAAAVCPISCQSDTHIWRYTYLNFSHYLAWNAYSGFHNRRFGGLWTHKCDYSSSRPPKGTSLRKSASFKLTAKIRFGVWLVGELTESVTDTQTHTLIYILSMHSPGQTISLYSQPITMNLFWCSL